MRTAFSNLLKQSPIKLLSVFPSRFIYQDLDRYLRRDKNAELSFETKNSFDSQIKPVNKNLQFTQSVLTPFGNLYDKDIPEPLKYSRPFQMTTLSNGLRVCSEYWPSKIASIGVFIGAGSRHETIQTSGTAHFMEHLHFKGTSKRTRHQLETEVENMGAHLNAFTSRELTVYHMQVFNKNVENACDILSDMLLNSLYKESNLEYERETILQELEEVNKDTLEVLLENAYFNAYREHMMGQPILGDRDNIKSVTRSMVVDFHDANYFAKNMVLVGTGNIDHNQLVEMAQKYFGGCRAEPVEGKTRYGLEKPIFIPALTMIRDDEMENSCIGVFYDAPSWMHEDYYTFLLIERIFGTYSEEKNGDQLNNPRKQYNSMHRFLSKYPGISKQQAIYSPYLDCGLFGNYFQGNEEFTKKMNFAGLHFSTKMADYLDDSEVIRAKNKIWMELSQIESASEVMQTIGQQVIYWGRRVSKAEIAKRISNFNRDDILMACYTWLFDAEPSITNWGPIGSTMDIGAYKYFKVHTTLPICNYSRLALRGTQK